ncbi:MAG: ComEC/Rec2 family competence protein [Acidobacteria bacterium]|nr:ComEC/Rec2 family competence protein [Acidobacteriota bacterium]
MSDRTVVLMAVLVCAGARVALPIPMPLVVAAVVVAIAARAQWLVVVAAAALASSLAASAWAGLQPPRPSRVDGWVTLVGDPELVHGALRVEARLDGRHLDGWARGAAASALRPRLAGEQVWVSGSIEPLPAATRRRLGFRHIAGRLSVEAVAAWSPGSAATRGANVLRRRLEAGARHLEPTSRSLLLGVVLGDRREQSQELVDDFRASGLSHLTAVSGENLAFVLALAAPLLRRLPLRWRWAVTVALVVWFALLTRCEPSVLRASAMAAIAATGALLGRPATAVRLLSLAVGAAVLLDPLLVHALGFRLSVGATAGIAVLAEPIARRLWGPQPVRTLLAVTVAAQLGVLPVALPAFGGLPLASLPANLLAVPAAAPLTAWGLTGALVAPSAGPVAERWLQLPTIVLTRWLAGVARWGAQLPLGQVRAVHVVVLVVAGAFVVSARWSWRWVRAASISRPASS